MRAVARGRSRPGLRSADQREADCSAPSIRPPFPLHSYLLRNGGDLSRARRFCAGLRTLDRFSPFRTIQSPRERGPGSQGACPLAEFEAAPHARLTRAAPPASHLLRSPLIASSRHPLFCSVDFPRALSPCFHPHSVCGLRRGACWCSQFKGCCHLGGDLGAQLPGSRTICRDLAVTPTRRFRILRRISILSQIPPISPYCCFSLCCRLALSSCPFAFRLYCGSYTSPVTHNRCSNTASFRATPTTAFFFRLLLPSSPLLLHFLHPPTRRSLSGAPRRKMQCAPCTNSLRSSSSPALLIPSSGWLSPLSRCFLVSPRYGPTSRLCSNRSGSSIVSTNVNAISVPTPYTCFSNFISGYRFAISSIFSSYTCDLFAHLLHALQQRPDHLLRRLAQPLRQRFSHLIGIAASSAAPPSASPAPAPC